MPHRSSWPIAQPIATRRLLLRPWQFADLAAMAAWPPFADPLDSAANWPHELEQLGSPDLFFWTRDSNPRRRELTIVRQTEVIGYLSIRDINSVERSSRLGIGFGAPFVGQGYGSEALAAFVSHYFGVWRFRLLRLEVAAHNTRARRLYQRIGFVERGYFDIDDGQLLVNMVEMELSGNDE